MRGTLRITLMQRPMLSPKIILRHFLKAIRNLFSVQVLLRRILRIRRSPKFIRANSLTSLSPRRLKGHSIKHLRFRILIVQFNINHLRLCFMFSFILFVRNLSSHIHYQLLLNQIHRVSTRFSRNNTINILHNANFPSTSNGRSSSRHHNHHHQRRYRWHILFRSTPSPFGTHGANVSSYISISGKCFGQLAFFCTTRRYPDMGRWVCGLALGMWPLFKVSSIRH